MSSKAVINSQDEDTTRNSQNRRNDLHRFVKFAGNNQACIQWYFTPPGYLWVGDARREEQAAWSGFQDMRHSSGVDKYLRRIERILFIESTWACLGRITQDQSGLRLLKTVPLRQFKILLLSERELQVEVQDHFERACLNCWVCLFSHKIRI